MKNKSLIYILLLTIFSSLTFNMAHPVTPNLIKTLGLPSFMFGVFFATMSLGNFVGSPLFGALSDNKGRIKFLILGTLGYGISQLGFGYITNPIIILIFRFTGGFFVVSYLTTSLAYITDLTTKETRTKYLTYYSAASTIGTALGSLFGGIIGRNNYKITFLVQFIFCVILGILVYFLLEETIVPDNQKFCFNFKPKTISTKLFNANLIVIFSIVILFYFSSTSYNSTINYFIEDVLNLSSAFIGGFLAVSGIIGFIASLLLTPWLTKHFNEVNVFKVVTLLLCISLALMVTSKNIIFFLCFALLFAALTAIHIPLQQTIITKLSHGNYGSLMGVMNSCKAVGAVSGSLLSGLIFDVYNKLPFLVASLVIFVGFIILLVKNIKEI